MMDNLELRPPKQNALASGLAETAGGALLVLAAATPLAAGAAGSAAAIEIGKRGEPEPEPGRRFARETEEAPVGATA